MMCDFDNKQQQFIYCAMKGFQLSGSSKRQKILSQETDTSLEKEIIVSIFNGDVESTSLASPVTPLVIPLVINASSSVVKPFDLTNQAELELIAELNGKQIPVHDHLIIETNLSVLDRKSVPILSSTSNNVFKNDDDRFKCDLNSSADDMNFRSDIYSTVPVSQFGAALLRGMGWMGDDPKEISAKDIEKLVPRENRLGLGAMAKPPDSKKHNKQKSSDGKTKPDDWSRKVEARLREQRLNDNDLVWLRDVRYAGRRARVTVARGVPGLDMIRVELETDGLVVEVGRKEAVLLTSEDLESRPFQPCTKIDNVIAGATGSDVKFFGENPSAKSDLSKLTGSNDSTTLQGDSKVVLTGRNDKVDVTHNCAKKLGGEKQGASSTPKDWLRPGIRVKIVSSNSSSYKQKGTVLDVVARGVACVRLDRGDVLSDLKERHLETILPEVGGMCVVLLGTYKGESAILLEKQWDVDCALVELVDDLQVITLPMDNVAACS